MIHSSCVGHCPLYRECEDFVTIAYSSSVAGLGWLLSVIVVLAPSRLLRCFWIDEPILATLMVVDKPTC